MLSDDTTPERNSSRGQTTSAGEHSKSLAGGKLHSSTTVVSTSHKRTALYGIARLLDKNEVRLVASTSRRDLRNGCRGLVDETKLTNEEKLPAITFKRSAH